MFYKLFNHSIKNIIRGITFDVNFVLRIITFLSFIYVCFAVFYLGLNYESIFRIYRPNMNPIDSFNSILIYLFLIGMLLLYFFQKRSTGDIIPYLHLPIRRAKVISYILVLTLFNFFNLGVILFIVPLSVRSILPAYGIQNFIFYLTGILLILISISYFVLFLRILINLISLFVLIPLGIVFIVSLSKIVLQVSFETISKAVFHSLLNGNIYFILLIFCSIIVLITANFLLLKDTIYSINSSEMGPFRTSKRFKATFFNSNIILYALLEIKLVTRNKRVRGFFIIAIVFIFLFYYTLQNKQNGIYISYIMYIILSGIFGYIFSQYMFSWESSYFDFISSTKFDLLKYLQAKYIIYVSFGLLVFIFFLPLIIQKKIDLHLFLTALLYNSCIGYFILFYMATFNRSRIELNSKIFFNLQGYNGTQMIALFVIIFLPCLILLLLTVVLNVTQSLLIINLLSIFSLIFQKQWFKSILKQLLNRKFINLEGYRK
jgi:hypothetical protein